jgi:D-alanyl-D-alanine dipeptidase
MKLQVRAHLSWMLLTSLLVLISLLDPASLRAREDHPPFGSSKDTSQLVELKTLDSSFRLDVRYATKDNFMGRVLYPQARVFLVRPAAEALVRAQRELKKENVGLLLFDGYRPWSITKKMWDETPPEKRDYVANPANGSRHNRGCAIDCSLFDLRTGKALEMPSAYDDFSEKAHPGWAGATSTAKANSERLRRALEKQGFQIYPVEWWHFDFKGYADYPVLNAGFESL